jgi:hypothetical protein
VPRFARRLTPVLGLLCLAALAYLASAYFGGYHPPATAPERPATEGKTAGEWEEARLAAWERDAPGDYREWRELMGQVREASRREREAEESAAARGETLPTGHPVRVELLRLRAKAEERRRRMDAAIADRDWLWGAP